MNVISDYNDFVKNPYLLNQFIGSQVEVFIKTTSPQSNALEDCLNGMITGLKLANAIGIQLDNIGIELDLSRNGLSDNDYRTLLYLQASIIISSGTPEAIYTLLRDFLGCLNVKVSFYYPAKVWVDQDSSFSLSDLFKYLIEIIPSGVNLGISSYVVTEDDSNLQTESGDLVIADLWYI